MEGTWKLNESKSKLTRGTGKNTKVVYDSRLIRDKMTVKTDGVDADGKPVHSEWKGRFNGKDYEVTGDPNADMRSYTKVNDQTLNIISKKGGKVVAQGRIVVSADGKSRVVTVSGTTAKGKSFRTRSFTTKNNPLGPRPDIRHMNRGIHWVRRPRPWLISFSFCFRGLSLSLITFR